MCQHIVVAYNAYSLSGTYHSPSRYLLNYHSYINLGIGNDRLFHYQIGGAVAAFCDSFNWE